MEHGITVNNTIDAIDLESKRQRHTLSCGSLEQDPAVRRANIATPRRRKPGMTANDVIDAVDIENQHQRHKLSCGSLERGLPVRYANITNISLKRFT